MPEDAQQKLRETLERILTRKRQPNLHNPIDSSRSLDRPLKPV